MTDRTEWRIRPARREDRDFIVGLTPRLGNGFPLPSWRTPDEIARAEAAALDAALESLPAGSALLVATDVTGVPAGFIYLQTLTDYFTQGRHAHVGILAVAAAAEGRGVGRALLEAGEGWARAQGLAMITLYVFDRNTRARAVYERLGYGAEMVRYVKPLDAAASGDRPS